MRPKTWIRLSSFALVGAVGVAVAADDVPPPYPSIMPAGGNIPQAPAVVPAIPQPVAPAGPTATLPVLPQLPPTVPAVKPAELPKTVAPVIPPPTATPVTPPPVVAPVAPPPKAEPAKPSSVNIKIGNAPGLQTEAGKLAAAINESKLAYDKLMDYSCHLIRQDRSGSKPAGELIYELHARTKPMSAYVKLVEPKAVAGGEWLFVAGRFATNQVRVKPAGGTFATVPMDDPRAMLGKATLEQIGLGAVLDRIGTAIATEAKLGNPMGVTVGDFAYAGRSVTRYEMICERAHAYRSSFRTVVYIDKELKLPIRVEWSDEPKSGTQETVSFVNLKTNVGHAAAVFER
jgi:hypothetical protein